MEELTKRMNPLHSVACQEIKQKFSALGIELEGENLINKTMAYLKSISKQVTNGVQYLTAKELAFEEVS